MRREFNFRAALSGVKSVSVHGPWTRLVNYRHLLRAPGGERAAPRPLWGGAAALAGARFTPKGAFDSIYLAQDPVTALCEVNSLLALPGLTVPVRTEPRVLVTVDGVVSRVLDLTDEAVLEALGTSGQEMTGAWAGMENPPTQLLGRAAYESGTVAAIRYRSAKNPGGINLVVFPDRLAASPGDFLEVFDSHRNLTQRIGG